MKDEPSPWRTRSVEDFLRTVYSLQQISTPVSTTKIAKALHIAPSSVVGMIDRLGVKKRASQYARSSYPPVPLLEHEHYRGVCLTSAGERAALQVIHRRCLVELYLIRMLGYTWDEVEAEADSLEHDLSEQLTERLTLALGNPEVDPYGEPIPTAEGEARIAADVSLAEIVVAHGGSVSRIVDHSPELLRYFAGIGLRPGADIRILSRSPLGDTITIQIGIPTNTQVLSTQIASHLRIVMHDKPSILIVREPELFHQ